MIKFEVPAHNNLPAVIVTFELENPYYWRLTNDDGEKPRLVYVDMHSKQYFINGNPGVPFSTEDEAIFRAFSKAWNDAIADQIILGSPLPI